MFVCFLSVFAIVQISRAQYSYPTPSPTKYIAPTSGSSIYNAPSAGPTIYSAPNPTPSIYTPARPLPYNSPSDPQKPFYEASKSSSAIPTTPGPTPSVYPKLYEPQNPKYPLTNEDDTENLNLLKQQNPIAIFGKPIDSFNQGALSPISRNENFIQGQRYISPNQNNGGNLNIMFMK